MKFNRHGGHLRPPTRLGIAHAQAPATRDEELLGAERASVTSSDTDAQRVARAAGELEMGFEALAHLGPAVSLFGSARTATDDPQYAFARDVAGRLGERGFAIITGGGPGIMEAGNRGARDAGTRSVGLNSRPGRSSSRGRRARAGSAAPCRSGSA